MQDWIMLAVSVVSSATISFSLFSFTMGRYREKVDKLDVVHQQYVDVLQRICAIEGGIYRDQGRFVKSKSPLSLTKEGKVLLLDSGGKDYIDARKNDFLHEITSYAPKTAYDVQELSKQVVAARTKLDEFNPLKEYAFKQGLKLDVVLEVLGIYLRDIALPHLNFKINDIQNQEDTN